MNMDSQIYEKNNVDENTGDMETTKLDEVTRKLQSNVVQSDCLSESKENACLQEVQACSAESTHTDSCDITNKTSDLINYSKYADCDKVDRIFSTIVEGTINMSEPKADSEKDNIDDETANNKISDTSQSVDNGITEMDAVIKDNCTSPIIKKMKSNFQSPNASIQEVVDKVDKLDIVGKPETNSNMSSVILKNESSSLRNLLMYHSESSDNEEDFEANWQVHVFPCSSSSSDSETDSQEAVEISDDDDDDEDSPEFVLPNNRNLQKKDDKQHFEPTDPPLDLSNLQIDYDNEIFTHIGHISNFINTTVTIDAVENTDSYNLETVLFIDDKTSKKPLGAISDVLGPVHQPMYCVQLHDAKDVETLGLKEGMKVYTAPKSSCTKYVFLKDLLRMKGTDASWIGDEEPPSDIDTSEEEFDMDEQAPRKRLHNNSLERHKKFEHAKNRCNTIKNQVANMFDKYKSKPRAPNIHMFPHGFDPRVPPPNMTTNVGFVPMSNPRQPAFNQWFTGSPYSNHPRRFPDNPQFRGHSNKYFTNNGGHHHNGAGPSHQNYY